MDNYAVFGKTSILNPQSYIARKKIGCKIQKLPISFISLVRINYFLHFRALHNDQNHPIRLKHPHTQVMYNVKLDQCVLLIFYTLLTQQKFDLKSVTQLFYKATMIILCGGIVEQLNFIPSDLGLLWK